MKSKTFWRIFWAFSGTLLATVLAVALLMISMVRSERTEALEGEVRSQAHNVAQLLEQNNINMLIGRYGSPISSTLEWKIKEITENIGADIWILSNTGYYIVPSSSKTSGSMRQYLSDPDILNKILPVFNGSEIQIRGLFPELGDHIVTIGVPWKLHNQVAGAVLLHISTDQLEVDYSDIVFKLAWAGMIALIIGTGMAYVITRKQILPIKKISSAVARFSTGDLNSRIEIKGNDELSELAKSINTMAEDLSNLENSRRSFVASVSHELRSPLTSIRGYIEGMLDDTIPPEENAKYLNVVLSESKRLTKLVNELLDLSRFESGDFPLHMDVFDINELIARTLIQYEQRINEKELTVVVAFRDPKCFVYADAERMEQVVNNLLDNAVKFSKHGGELVIKTYTAGDLKYVSISNQGEVISPEDLPFVFERFYKADKAHTSGMGTGLGLSIVKKIIEQHHQEIQVSSSSKETVFTFSLSAAQEETKAQAVATKHHKE